MKIKPFNPENYVTLEGVLELVAEQQKRIENLGTELGKRRSGELVTSEAAEFEAELARIKEHANSQIHKANEGWNKCVSENERLRSAVDEIRNETPYLGCLSKQWVMDVLNKALKGEEG